MKETWWIISDSGAKIDTGTSDYDEAARVLARKYPSRGTKAFREVPGGPAETYADRGAHLTLGAPATY